MEHEELFEDAVAELLIDFFIFRQGSGVPPDRENYPSLAREASTAGNSRLKSGGARVRCCRFRLSVEMLYLY
jgi:hypothetical protein